MATCWAISQFWKTAHDSSPSCKVVSSERANSHTPPEPFMTSAELNTTELRALLDRSQAGDRSAREALSQSVYRRLEQLARQMLRRFPTVRFHEETGDVLNAAMIRFLKA